jgi:hypothetical protein
MSIPVTVRRQEEGRGADAMVPVISSEKPQLPTLWVDTFVGLDLAKGKPDPRLQHLKDIVWKLVRDGKLLCPQADQEEEYQGTRLYEAATREFESLSLSIRFHHRQGILDHQVALAMKAFAAKAEAFTIPLNTYFHEAPVKKLAALRGERIFISVPMPALDELQQRRESAKTEGQEQLEALRKQLVAEGQAYDKQFAVEQKGHVDVMIEMAAKWQTWFKSDSTDAWKFLGFQSYLLYRHLWNELRAKPTGLRGLREFFRSPYFGNLPLSRISSQLYADILTDKEREVQPSDSMDIQLLSAVIPACHYALTDKNMEDRIKRRNIAQEWATQVFSLRTIDGLFAELERI